MVGTQGWTTPSRRTPARVAIAGSLRTRPAARSTFFGWFGTDGFLGAISAQLDEWGNLTEKQEAAVRKIMADRKERAEKRDAEREANGNTPAMVRCRKCDLPRALDHP